MKFVTKQVGLFFGSLISFFVLIPWLFAASINIFKAARMLATKDLS